jgi:CopA family copper-resistance protein
MRIHILSLCLFILNAMSSVDAAAGVVRYELNVEQKPVNVSGNKEVHFAMTVNGTIPSPTLRFTEGDDAEIHIKNHLDEETSIHWHGILLPNIMDGVSYVTTPPIPAKGEFTFKFKIRQSGTYWYHSHTGTQEQKGVFGSFVIEERSPKEKFDHDLVYILSDWTDEDPDQVMKNLRKDGDYYLYKKGTIQSIWGAYQAKSLSDYFGNEWMRMGGMDLSDVGYDAFLVNGVQKLDVPNLKAGQRLRIRIINGSASSYFFVNLGQQKFKVIAADGKPVKPLSASELIMGMGETYDIDFTIPETKTYELRAMAQDVSGSASVFLRAGSDVESVPHRELPNAYVMQHGGHGGHDSHSGHGEAETKVDPHANHKTEVPANDKHAGHDPHANHKSASDKHAGHDMHAGHKNEQPSVGQVTYEDLASPEATSWVSNGQVPEIPLVLDGDMERYTWTLNGKTMAEADPIDVKEGDLIQFKIVNNTMMHHPIHLHGHFFKILNGKGDHAPWKHTVDLPPFSSQVIRFKADEPGRWLLHCHNLYHMKSGMGTMLFYTDFKPDEAMKKYENMRSHPEHWYRYGEVAWFTNYGRLYGRASTTRNQVDGMLEFFNNRDLEWEVMGRRWFTPFFNLGIGGAGGDDAKTAGKLSMQYTLPMLIETQLSIDSNGEWEAELEKLVRWTQSFKSDFEASINAEEAEGTASLMYEFGWHVAFGLRYDSDDKWGIGLEGRF